MNQRKNNGVGEGYVSRGKHINSNQTIAPKFSLNGRAREILNITTRALVKDLGSSSIRDGAISNTMVQIWAACGKDPVENSLAKLWLPDVDVEENANLIITVAACRAKDLKKAGGRRAEEHDLRLVDDEEDVKFEPEKEEMRRCLTHALQSASQCFPEDKVLEVVAGVAALSHNTGRGDHVRPRDVNERCEGNLDETKGILHHLRKSSAKYDPELVKDVVANPSSRKEKENGKRCKPDKGSRNGKRKSR